jgi:hypothetical protein
VGAGVGNTEEETVGFVVGDDVGANVGGCVGLLDGD